jgi:hypothetical protein
VLYFSLGMIREFPTSRRVFLPRQNWDLIDLWAWITGDYETPMAASRALEAETAVVMGQVGEKGLWLMDVTAVTQVMACRRENVARVGRAFPGMVTWGDATSSRNMGS